MCRCFIAKRCWLRRAHIFLGVFQGMSVPQEHIQESQVPPEMTWSPCLLTGMPIQSSFDGLSSLVDEHVCECSAVVRCIAGSSASLNITFMLSVQLVCSLHGVKWCL